MNKEQLNSDGMSSATNLMMMTKKPVLLNGNSKEYKQDNIEKYSFAHDSDRAPQISIGDAYDEP